MNPTHQPNPAKWRFGVGILTVAYLVVSPVLGTILLIFSDNGLVDKVKQIPRAFADAANSKGVSTEERRRRSEIESQAETRSQVLKWLGLLCWLGSLPSSLIGAIGSFRNRASADKHIAIAVCLWLAAAAAGWLNGGWYVLLFVLVGIPLAIALCLRAARTDSATPLTPASD